MMSISHCGVFRYTFIVTFCTACCFAKVKKITANFVNTLRILQYATKLLKIRIREVFVITINLLP